MSRFAATGQFFSVLAFLQVGAAGADVGDALTPEPGEQERQEAAPTGGGCRASAGGTPDVAHVAILLGLVGAGLRRRWRGGAKGEG